MKIPKFKVNGSEQFEIEFDEAGMRWFLDVLNVMFGKGGYVSKSITTLHFNGPRRICPLKPKSSPRK